MSIDLSGLITSKIAGITPSDIGYSNLISAGAVDILEKIKTYKPNDLQKFIVEQNIRSEDESIWTQFNATAIYAWEIMGVKRSMDLSVDPENTIPSKWKAANPLNIENKNDYLDSESLKFIGNAYPGFTIESYTNNEEDGDNDQLADSSLNGNYIITVFPQVTHGYYHAWKMQYIPIPTGTGLYSVTNDFHASYIPALAIYVAKNIILNEMNRLLLLEEDLELASELKNHYALLEQEYAGLMNIPPTKKD